MIQIVGAQVQNAIGDLEYVFIRQWTVINCTLYIEDATFIAYFFIYLLSDNLKFCLMPGSNLLKFCVMLCKHSLKISSLTELQSSNWKLSHSQHNTPNLILGRILFCIFPISSTGLNRGSKLLTVWRDCSPALRPKSLLIATRRRAQNHRSTFTF